MSQESPRRTARPQILDDDFGAMVEDFGKQLEQRPTNPYEREGNRSAPAAREPAPVPDVLPSAAPVTEPSRLPEAPARPAPTATGTSERTSARVQMTVRIRPELRERARNTAYWLSGPPERLGIQDIFERALELMCVHLEKKYNEEQPFPSRDGELKRGRRA